MSMIDILGAFITGIIAIAALSLIVAPKSNAANVINSLGTNMSSLLTAAKSNPF